MEAAGSDWLVLQHIGQIAVTCTSNKRLVSVDCFCDIYTLFSSIKKIGDYIYMFIIYYITYER